MMDYMALLYLAVFPVVTIIIGWSILSRGLAASDDKLALRKVQRWRFVLAFCLFALAWLVIVAGGLVAFSQIAPLLSRDYVAAMALSAGVLWLGCAVYWLTLIYSAGDVLHLPADHARRAASAALLWNLVATVPFVLLSVPAHAAEPLRMLAGM